jgi:hypothetical protein
MGGFVTRKTIHAEKGEKNRHRRIKKKNNNKQFFRVCVCVGYKRGFAFLGEKKNERLAGQFFQYNKRNGLNETLARTKPNSFFLT